MASVADRAATLCPVCSGTRTGMIVFGQPAWRCQDCTHRFRSSAYIENFDYQWYTDNAYWFEDGMYYLQQRAWLALFSEWVQGTAFAEFGAASGELITEIKRIRPGSTVLYSDISDVCAVGVQADRKCIGPVEKVANSLSAEGERYDGVFMFNVVEHSKHPREVLSATRSLLAKNGRVFIITDNGDDIHGDEALMHHAEHMHIWSKQSWAQFVDQVGGLRIEMFWGHGPLFYTVLEATG